MDNSFKLLIIIMIIISLSCKEDIQKEYYSSGDLKSEYKVNDLEEKDGFYKRYYENGTVDFETNFSNGKRNGKYKKYYKSGKIESLREFRMDTIVNYVYSYFENGIIKTKIHFENGIKNGDGYLYYENGKIKKYFEMLNNVVVYEIEYSKTGVFDTIRGNPLIELVAPKDRKFVSNKTYEFHLYPAVPPNTTVIIKYGDLDTLTNLITSIKEINLLEKKPYVNLFVVPNSVGYHFWRIEYEITFDNGNKVELVKYDIETEFN